ncbi:MAG: acyl--CoA ligase, partial [Planctomycetes bacterium]|nr:acyl--CoA ligase [Planctomycetota bacterium]
MVREAPTALILTGLPRTVAPSAPAAGLALVQAIRRDVNLRIDPGHTGHSSVPAVKFPPVPVGLFDSALHLGRLFETIAEHRGAAPALTNRTVVWSYQALRQAARSVADRLQSQPNFRPGDRVVVLLGNSPEYIASFYGVLLAGGVVVPLAPRTEVGMLGAVLDSTEAVALITDPATWKVRSDLAGCPSQKCDLAMPHDSMAEALDLPGSANGH